MPLARAYVEEFIDSTFEDFPDDELAYMWRLLQPMPGWIPSPRWQTLLMELRMEIQGRHGAA